MLTKRYLIMALNSRSWYQLMVMLILVSEPCVARTVCPPELELKQRYTTINEQDRAIEKTAFSKMVFGFESSELFDGHPNQHAQLLVHPLPGTDDVFEFTTGDNLYIRCSYYGTAVSLIVTVPEHLLCREHRKPNITTQTCSIHNEN